MNARTNNLLFASGLIVVGLVGFGYVFRGPVRNALIEYGKPPVPSAQPRLSPTATPSGSTSSPLPSVAGTPSPLAAEINLLVPFVSQAPLQVWDHDHEEFCEEAAALMAASYMTGDTSVKNPTIADQRLYAIKAWEMQTFGYFEDTTAAQTARILKEFLNISAVELVNNPTVEQVKSFLAAGRLVIVPAAGRTLASPFYTPPGPLYHNLLLKGYTKNNQFITNDAGTRHGADFLFPVDNIMSSMHDYNGGDLPNGAKVIIVVG